MHPGTFSICFVAREFVQHALCSFRMHHRFYCYLKGGHPTKKIQMVLALVLLPAPPFLQQIFAVGLKQCCASLHGAVSSLEFVGSYSCSQAAALEPSMLAEIALICLSRCPSHTDETPCHDTSQ